MNRGLHSACYADCVSEDTAGVLRYYDVIQAVHSANYADSVSENTAGVLRYF